MQLNTDIPLLFGTPKIVDVKKGLASLFLMLGLGTAIYMSSLISDAVPYFWLMTALIGLHGIATIRRTGANILYLFRYFLIWVLVFASTTVWAIYGGDVAVAPWGQQYQTHENTMKLVYAGFLSMSGAAIGWLLVFRRMERNGLGVFALSRSKQKLLSIAGGLLALSAGLSYLYATGGFVGSVGAYGSKPIPELFQFGVFNIFHYVGIAILLLASLAKGKINNRVILFILLTLMMGMLAGSRADYMPQALILLLLLYHKRINFFLRRFNYRKLVAFSVVGFLLVGLAYVLGSFIAIWRTTGDVAGTLDLLFRVDRLGIIIPIYGQEMLWLETGNMMLGGLYAAIVNVEQGSTGLLLGESYFDWLLKAPPAFFGLPRPEGLEWAMDIAGERMSQGGVFEVAEAYWNFGFVGCFFVSFSISYFFGFLLKKGLKENNLFFLTWYLVFGFMGLRAIWYQNFSYFRIMTVMLVIYMIAWLFARWFIKNDRVRESDRGDSRLQVGS